LRVQGIKDSQEKQSRFYEKNYESAKGRYDLYILFIEQSLRLIKNLGKVCLILPHNFINANSGKSIRKMLVYNRNLSGILHFGSNLVFNDASTYTCILTLTNDSDVMSYAEVNPHNIFDAINFSYINTCELKQDKWELNSPAIKDIFDKLNLRKRTLGDVCKNISRGVVTGYDGVFILSGKIKGDTFNGFSKSLDKKVSFESELLKPILMGSSFSRYSSLEENLYILYTHELLNGKTVPINQEKLENEYPDTYQYLLEFKEELVKKKIKYKTNPEYWYALHNI